MKFTRDINRLLLCILLLNIKFCFADENKENSSKTSPLNEFLVVEGVTVLLSAFAASDPKTFGGVLALGAPLALALNSESEVRFWTGLVLMESLAFYNLKVIDKNNSSESEIFSINFVAINITNAFDYYTRQKYKSNYALSYLPLKGGGLAQLRYRF